MHPNERSWLANYRKYNALLRYYFRSNPSDLSDEEWAMQVGEVTWLIKHHLTPKKPKG